VLDRRGAGDDVAVAVEQAVEVAQAVRAVADQQADAYGSQLDTPQGARIRERRWQGRFVDPGRSARSVAGAVAAVDASVQSVEAIEARPARCQELSEVVVDGSELDQRDGVGPAELGVEQAAGDAAFGHGIPPGSR
jgi:hypothetical protein